jgi:hypothetical protein
MGPRRGAESRRFFFNKLTQNLGVLGVYHFLATAATDYATVATVKVIFLCALGVTLVSLA